MYYVPQWISSNKYITDYAWHRAIEENKVTDLRIDEYRFELSIKLPDGSNHSS